MPQTVITELEYPLSAEDLWRQTIRWDLLHAIMEGGTSQFKEVPEGDLTVGQILRTPTKLFGFLPIGDWVVEITDRDDAAHVLKSREHGFVVKSWVHTLSVHPLAEDRALQRDEVVIDAGMFTGGICKMAHAMYVDRHQRRLAYLTGAPMPR